jgi:hypothetical protein
MVIWQLNLAFTAAILISLGPAATAQAQSPSPICDAPGQTVALTSPDNWPVQQPYYLEVPADLDTFVEVRSRDNTAMPPQRLTIEDRLGHRVAQCIFQQPNSLVFKTEWWDSAPFKVLFSVEHLRSDGQGSSRCPR